MKPLQWALLFLLIWIAVFQLATLAGLNATTIGSLVTALATLVLVGVTANYVRLTRDLLREDRIRSHREKAGIAAELGSRLLLVASRGSHILENLREGSDTPVEGTFEELVELKSTLARLGMTESETAEATVRLTGVLDRIAVWSLSPELLPPAVHAWLHYDVMAGVSALQVAAWEILGQRELAADFSPPDEPKTPRPDTMLPSKLR